MTTSNAKDTINEIHLGLASAISGTGKPASSVYKGQKKELKGESPAVLVMFSGVQRSLAGVGTQLYENKFDIEVQYLVYNGSEDNPLDEDEREDALADCEAAAAGWFATHQKGTTYRSLTYTPNQAQVIPIKYIDGNPYLMLSAMVTVERRDTA